MLSPVNPPSKTMNLRVVLETPDTHLSVFSSSSYDHCFLHSSIIQLGYFVFFCTWRDVGNLVFCEFLHLFHCEIKHLEKCTKHKY